VTETRLIYIAGVVTGLAISLIVELRTKKRGVSTPRWHFSFQPMISIIGPRLAGTSER
jgi:hypothetical protein